MRRRPDRLSTSLAVTSLLLGCLIALPARAQDSPPADTKAALPLASVDVTITPSNALPETLSVGEPLTLTFTINHPREAILVPPEDAGSSRFVISDAAITALTSPENGPHTSSLALTLLPLRAGTAPLDGLKLAVAAPDGSSLAMPLRTDSIKFVSVLTDEENTLKGPRPPHVIKQEDYTPVKIAAGVAGALLLLALVALGVRALKPLPEPPKPLPIDVLAMQALRALEQASLEGDVALVSFYTQMSEVLRDYLGKRYDFPGTEYTTSEILDALPVMLLPPSLGVTQIAQWLRRSDRVKFSSSRPAAEDALADLRQAMAMVELTKPPLEAPEEVPSTEKQDTTHEEGEVMVAPPVTEVVVEEQGEVSSDTPPASQQVMEAHVDEPPSLEEDASVAAQEKTAEDNPEDVERERAVDEALMGSALGAMSWDDLSELVEDLDDLDDLDDTSDAAIKETT